MANETGSNLVNQSVELTFQLAWGEFGTSWERFLASIISGAPALRILCNGIIFTALVRHRALRETKEYLLMIYTAFYDFFDGCWMFCCFYFYYPVQSRLSCFLTFRHFWYLFSGQSSVTMLLMISIDRVLSVAFPVWYWMQPHRLGHKLGATPMAWSLLFAPYLAVAATQYKPQELIPHCFTTYTFKGYSAVFMEFMLRRTFLGASVGLYGIVILIYTYKRIASLKKVAASQNRDVPDDQWKKFKAQQKKMTITLGISAAATLIGYVIPLSLFDVVRINFPNLQQYGWLLWVPINLSSVSNLFIFARQREVKKALGALVKWKRMPDRIEDWQPKTGQVRQITGLTSANQTAGQSVPA